MLLPKAEDLESAFVGEAHDSSDFLSIRGLKIETSWDSMAPRCCPKCPAGPHVRLAAEQPPGWASSSPRGHAERLRSKTQMATNSQ